MGALHYRCALPGFVETPGHPGDPGAAAGAMIAGAARRMLRGGGGGSGGGAVAGGGGQSEWDTGVFCKVADAASCADLEGASCAFFDDNPNSGLLSFDSVAWAFVNILQVMTFDTWTDGMFALMTGVSGYAWIYFVTIAFLGGLFVVNLFLCVIFDEFMKSQEADDVADLVNEAAVEQEASWRS